MRRIAYFLTAGRSWIYLENGVEMLPVDQMGEDALGHGAAADIAVADEEYFYHDCNILSYFCITLHIFANTH